MRISNLKPIGMLAAVALVVLAVGLSMGGTDDFKDYPTGMESPAVHDADVTPNDSTDLTHYSRTLYVTTGGTIKYTTVGGETVTRTVPDYFVMPVRVKRVWATGTTATGICNWY